MLSLPPFSRPRFLPLAARQIIMAAVLIACGASYSLQAQEPAPGAANQSATTAGATPTSADSKLASELVEADGKGRHLAPPDTFYLLKYVSAKTDTGVIGFIPGQEVRLVEVHRPTETLVVTDGQNQVEVSPVDLTNDRDMAALARGKDQAAQDRVSAYAQAALAAYKKAQKEGAENTARDIQQRKDEQKELADSIREARQERQQQQQSTVQAADPVNNGPGDGYYGYNGDGYGSPFAYFVGEAAANSLNNANRNVPATSQATKPALPNNVAAPARANVAPPVVPATVGSAGRPPR